MYLKTDRLLLDLDPCDLELEPALSGKGAWVLALFPKRLPPHRRRAQAVSRFVLFSPDGQGAAQDAEPDLAAWFLFQEIALRLAAWRVWQAHPSGPAAQAIIDLDELRRSWQTEAGDERFREAVRAWKHGDPDPIRDLHGPRGGGP